MPRRTSSPHCPGITRRSFLADTGMGFTGLALGALLFKDGVAQADAGNAPPDGKPHFAPKAKSVIWLFMCGGVSHVESFDVKPELNKYNGKTIDSTPYKDVLNPEKLKDLVSANPAHGGRRVLMGLNTGHQKHGQCGLDVADWWQHTGSCADDIAVVRSLWTSDNDHGAQLQWHTGRHVREGGIHPTIGSWTCYGLGTLNQNLPEYVVLGVPTGDCCGGEWTHGAGYLGPEYAGVRLSVEGKDPLPFVAPGARMTRAEQEAEFGLLGKLNRLAGVDYPDDPALRFGARRLVERGVRFVQIFHGGGGGGAWDAHGGIKVNHGGLSAQVDLPISGLLKDLKQRGLLQDTLVVWGTEFGRSPGAQGDGRDHHPQGFCAWLAGGGIRGGVAHGATDEIGFHAIEHRHYVTDIHATVLQQLGLDPHKLEVPGRKRLEIDHGKPIKEIIA